MKNIFNLFQKLKFDFFILILYSVTFIYLIINIKGLDIKDHNIFLQEYLNYGYFPFPPGYYFLIYLVDMFIHVQYPFIAASVIVLTFFSWWKYKILFSWLRIGLKVSDRKIFFFSIVLIFLSPIYIFWIDGDSWLLGKFSTFIWHNSTLIAVFPPSILCFKYSLDWINFPSKKNGLLIIGLGLIVMLFKPSFLFSFIPSFPIVVLLIEKKVNKKVISAIGIVTFLFFMILLEKFIIYNWDPMIDHLYSQSQQSQVILAPMKVWLYFSDKPFYDFFSSFPLLITFLFFWGKEAFSSDFFLFSFLNLFFALLVFAVLAETGFREFHGNFYWQIPIALFLNCLSIALVVIKEFLLTLNKNLFKYYVIFGIFCLQSISGVFYWVRIFLLDTLA